MHISSYYLNSFSFTYIQGLLKRCENKRPDSYQVILGQMCSMAWEVQDLSEVRGKAKESCHNKLSSETILT